MWHKFFCNWDSLNNTGWQLKQGLGDLSAGNGFGVEDLYGMVASGLFWMCRWEGSLFYKKGVCGSVLLESLWGFELIRKGFAGCYYLLSPCCVVEPGNGVVLLWCSISVLTTSSNWCWLCSCPLAWNKGTASSTVARAPSFAFKLRN